MIHLWGASKGCLDGVHVHICLCGYAFFVSSVTAIPVSLVFWVETLRPFCAAGGAVWILAFVKFRWREKIFQGHRQLSPFRLINLCCLPNMVWYFTQSPFRKKSNPTFFFFKFGEKNISLGLRWEKLNQKYSQVFKLNVHLCKFFCFPKSSSRNVCFETPTTLMTHTMSSRGLIPNQ